MCKYPWWNELTETERLVILSRLVSEYTKTKPAFRK